jgi:hypothetical protein
MRLPRRWKPSAALLSGGTIQFTREDAEVTQVYTDSLSGSTIAGSFNQNGQGQYPWSASKVIQVKPPASKSNPSIYAITTDGGLLWYKHLGFADGSDLWENNGYSRQIGTGWQTFLHVFNGGT